MGLVGLAVSAWLNICHFLVSNDMHVWFLTLLAFIVFKTTMVVWMLGPHLVYFEAFTCGWLGCFIQLFGLLSLQAHLFQNSHQESGFQIFENDYTETLDDLFIRRYMERELQLNNASLDLFLEEEDKKVILKNVMQALPNHLQYLV